ncbi:MAG TPA: helix-turn-helix domain-containing protein [Rhodoblastus sp.]|nr:helix-turn-helix domain-containing protein [Rhodoblastus sp.]
MELDHRSFLAILLRVGGFRHAADPNEAPLWLDISQSELAILCNLSRTSVGSFLHKLEADGLAGIRYGQIGVLAPAALRALLKRDR